MEKINFTEAVIEAIKPTDKIQIFKDANGYGLNLRVNPTGKKAYFFQKKLNAQTIRFNLGAAGRAGITLEEARKKAARYASEVMDGINPANEKQRKINAEKEYAKALKAQKSKENAEATKLLALWIDYVEQRKDEISRNGRKWSALHLRDHYTLSGSGGFDESRHLNVKPNSSAILQPLLKLSIAELNHDKIETWLKEQNKTRSTRASLGLSLFGAFLRWVKLRAYNDLDPEQLMLAAKKSKIKPTEKNHDSMSIDELSAWFKAAQAQTNETARTFLQVLLLTGARPHEEVAKIKWRDIDLKRREIKIHDKVEGTRFIPLHHYVERLIFSLPKQGEYVFYGTGRFGHMTRPTKVHDAIIEASGINHVTMHGFRRTFKNMGRIAKVLTIYVDKVQGHKPKSVSELNYSFITIDELRPQYEKIVNFILDSAGIDQSGGLSIGHLSIAGGA